MLRAGNLDSKQTSTLCEQGNVCLHFQKEVPENQVSSEAKESAAEMWIFYHHLFELGLLYF